MDRADVFVIDDDEQILKTLQTLLSVSYEVSTYKNPVEARRKIIEHKPDVVVSDVKMNNIDGIELLKDIREKYPSVNFILMSAYTSTKLAIEATQVGAVDYITKPFENDKVLESVERAVSCSHLSTDSKLNKVMHSSVYSKRSERLVGTSPRMLEIYKTIGKISNTKSNVLIKGESGTGKELIARLIAQTSNVDNDTFMTVNCSAIPETLFESELFGHEKGSFTGADSQKKGKVEACEGGILFLDEIDTLPLLVQSKVLRLIQQKEFQRVGGIDTISADVRIIAAVKHNIMEKVESGEFKEDLYYRLSVISIDVPPLRERRDDIVKLFNYFLTETNKKHGRKIKNVSTSLIDKLRKYDWPGNVRELENAVERAVIMAASDILTEYHFPFIPGKGSENGGVESLETEDIDRALSNIIRGISENYCEKYHGSVYDHILKVVEKNLIEKTLNRTKGNQVRTAEILGLSRNTLRDRIHRYGLDNK